MTLLKRLVFTACAPLSLAMALATPRTARAVGSPVSAAATRSQRAPESAGEVTRWYGYQTLIADVAGAVLMWRGFSTYRSCTFLNWDQPPSPAESCGANNDRASAMILGGAVLYQFGAPSVHTAHGHWERAGYSFGARILPVLGGIAINGFTHDDDTGSVVMLGGMATVMMFDSIVLARETVPVAPRALQIAPTYEPRSRTGAIMVGGAF